MSAIAGFMADKGHDVYGSDRAFQNNPAHPAYLTLKAKGALIVPQDGKALDSSFDLAVFSTAVEADQPEVVRAGELGIKTRTRPEYLADIVAEHRTIAIAGTSGKSTVSGMLAFVMKQLGMSPNFIGGGRVKQFRSPSNPGNSIVGDSDLLVVEACESDGSIVNYKPKQSVILNLDLDHHSIGETARMFGLLAMNTEEKVFVNADDIDLKSVAIKEPVHFSINSPSGYTPEDIVLKPFGTDFRLKGTLLSLSIPGKYNLYNALATVAVLSEMGIAMKDIAPVLPEFRGIERRFDVYLNEGGKLVIDDYAHNPHKIASLMEAMVKVKEKICYIFQPHGFGPTRMMKDGYVNVFARHLRPADRLILLPIYYFGGTAVRDISSEVLAQGIRDDNRSAIAVENRGAVLDNAGAWDNYVILGARDETLSDFAKELATRLK